MHRATFLALMGLAAACVTPPPPRPAKQPFPGTEPRAALPSPAAGAPATDAATGVTNPAGQPSTATQRDVMEEIAQLVERDPRAWASRYPKNDQCEAAARALRGSSGERAWRGLRACVARGPFRQLAKLTDGFWDEDLRTRSDAPVVLASVIASRGADIVNDVETLQRRRVPLFTLEIAKSNPDMYRGRSVIFTAAIDSVKPTKGGKATARLAVVTLGSVGKRVVVSSDEYNRSYGSRRGSVSSGWGSVTTTRYDNQAEETDEIIIGRLNSVDPFLAPGRRFVVVGRFEGFTTPNATPDDPEPDKVPVTSIYAYFEPVAQAALATE